MLYRCLLIFVVTILPCAQLFAQSSPIDIQLDPQKGLVSDTFKLTIRYKGIELSKIDKPTLSSNEQFYIKLANQGFEKEISSTGITESSVLTYNIIPNNSLTPGVYRLPDFEITLSGKVYPVKGPKITISPTETDPLNSNVSFRQVVDTTKPYVGQQVTYRAKLLTGPLFVRGDLGELDIPNVLREDLGSNKQRTKQIGNKFLTIVTEALIPTKSGKIVIPQRELHATMRTSVGSSRRSVFDFDPFNPLSRRALRRAVKRKIVANGLELEVRPLPPAPKEATDYTPVGIVQLSSKLSDNSLSVGQSATLSIELVGNANLRPYELPKPIDKVDGFKVYNDQPQISTSASGDKIIYRKKFSIALVATKPGKLDVPRFRVISFNPLKSKYVEHLSDPFTIEVSGKALPASLENYQQDLDDLEDLGEGLLPQHEGPELYKSAFTLRKQTFLLLLFALALLSFATRFYLIAKANRGDPERLLRANAKQKAISSLKKNEVIVDEAWSILVNYVKERFLKPSDTFEVEKLPQVIKAEEKENRLCLETKEVFDLLSNKRFSGQATATLRDFEVDAICNVIESLEKEAIRNEA